MWIPSPGLLKNGILEISVSTPVPVHWQPLSLKLSITLTFLALGLYKWWNILTMVRVYSGGSEIRVLRIFQGCAVPEDGGGESPKAGVYIPVVLHSSYSSVLSDLDARYVAVLKRGTSAAAPGHVAPLT
jgi:hypothetical protein